MLANRYIKILLLSTICIGLIVFLYTLSAYAISSSGEAMNLMNEKNRAQMTSRYLKNRQKSAWLSEQKTLSELPQEVVEYRELEEATKKAHTKKMFNINKIALMILVICLIYIRVYRITSSLKTT